MNLKEMTGRQLHLFLTPTGSEGVKIYSVQLNVKTLDYEIQILSSYSMRDKALGLFLFTDEEYFSTEESAKEFLKTKKD